MTIQQEDYTVRLEQFQGPLDLLLFLIRRNEVDVGAVPIATITDQYLGFLRQIDRIDIELAADFLVMAATLLEIKSRLLMPVGEDTSADEQSQNARTIDETLASLAGVERSDPRFALICQLLAFKKFRDAAEALCVRRDRWLDRFAVAPARVSTETPSAAESFSDSGQSVPIDLEDAGVWDLFAAFQRIIEAVDFGRLGEHRVTLDDTPISLHQTDLLDLLGRAQAKQLSLRAVFEGRSRGEMVGLFIAVLELVRQRKVTVRQGHPAEEIWVSLNPAEPELSDDGAVSDQQEFSRQTDQ